MVFDFLKIDAQQFWAVLIWYIVACVWLKFEAASYHINVPPLCTAALSSFINAFMEVAICPNFCQGKRTAQLRTQAIISAVIIIL